MLVKRNEKNGVINALYESSNIMASTYVMETNQLTIVFKSGVGYQYEGVIPKDYSKFELADSQGVVFNKDIKQHTFKAIGEVDIEAIRKQLEDSKADELVNYTKSILKITGELIEGEVFSETELNDLILLCNKLKEKLA